MTDDCQVQDTPHDGATASDGADGGVVYPTSDKMGESSLQFFVNARLVALLSEYFAATNHPAFVSSNQFFYFKRGDPGSSVSPDLYIVDDESREPTSVPSWKVWEHDGKVPAFVLEVVSDEYKKDYADHLIDRYERLGIREMVRYDPGHGGRRGRSLLTHFVRDEGGRLIARPTPPDRVQSAVFGFWLVLQPDRTIRLATGPLGEALWPTPEERAALAEAEVSRLRAELARLRGE